MGLRLLAATGGMAHGQRPGLAAGSADRALPLLLSIRERYELCILAMAPRTSPAARPDHQMMKFVTQCRRKVAVKDT